MTETLPLIRVVYSLYPSGIDGDMYYTVDRTTGKQTRIADKEARDLIAKGKAVAWLDYDSIAKIEFVISETADNRAYRINDKGRKTEISFKEALRLILEGKANLYNIRTD